MLEILFSLFIFIIFTLSAGLFATNYILGVDKNQLHLFEIGLIGITFLTFLSFLIHFFLPLNTFTNLATIILIVIFGLINNIRMLLYNIKKESLIIIFSMIVVLIMTLNYKVNEDYGYYHLPYIINLISEKIIFGLSNLQPQFGWNSSWLNFSSILYLPLLELKGTQLSNSLLYFFVFCIFLKELLIKKNNNNLSRYFIVFLSFYVIIKFSRISAHGFDFPANIFLLISLYYFLKISETENEIKLKKYFVLVSIFSTLSLTIKLSTFIAPLLVFSSFLIIISYKVEIKFFIKTFLFCSAFILVWLLQQFVYTGCFVPMFEFTCIKSVNWYTHEISDSIKAATGAVNKSVRNYTGILSEEEYLKNFNWVATWFKRNKIEFLEHFSAFIIPYLIVISFNLKKTLNSHRNFSLLEKNNFIFVTTVFFFIFIGLFFWFIKSPVIRFGVPYLFGFVFFLIVFLVNYSFKRNFVLEKGIKITLILAVVFNISKNINRIKDFDHKGSFWPELIYVEFSSLKKEEYTINYPDSKETSIQHHLCWSIPFICHIDSGKNIYINKKNNYLVISQK